MRNNNKDTYCLITICCSCTSSALQGPHMCGGKRETGLSIWGTCDIWHDMWYVTWHVMCHMTCNMWHDICYVTGHDMKYKTTYSHDIWYDIPCNMTRNMACHVICHGKICHDVSRVIWHMPLHITWDIPHIWGNNMDTVIFVREEAFFFNVERARYTSLNRGDTRYASGVADPWVTWAVLYNNNIVYQI